MIILTLMFSVTLSLIINFIWIKLTSINLKKNREKKSPYECGFNPFTSPRIPFSFQFFFISLLFILFDIEIALILPKIIQNSFTSESINNKIIFILLIYLFFMTSIMEWIGQMIKYSNSMKIK